jgi:hypothetical protein
MAKALEMNLKITFINAIGRDNLMESAPGTLGRRERTSKFSLEMSNLPKAKSLRIRKTRGFNKGQKSLKKATGKASGPRAILSLV